jgi:protein O-mannosyl-transferase
VAKRRSQIKPAPSVSKSASISPRGRRLLLGSPDLFINLLLLAAVFVIYARVLHFDFVTFDDPEYVTENPQVQAGLSLGGVAWAVSSSAAGSWFPLTWLSHMLDCQLFGLDSGWHHFTSVCIHALSTLLWFTVLHRITGARWKSAMVAFLFALHPLHVESVAWVCERKDVLSAMFCALTVWAYAGYVAKPRTGRYLLTLFLFCLGLMAKPMLATLPFVLLLLDRWPFGRGLKILEKVPFLAASIADSIVTYVVHVKAGALPSLEQVPVGVRIENALVSYALYIFQAIWPVKLAVFYPYSQESLVIPALIAAIAIAAVTVLAIRELPRSPYFIIGWLWYLTMLLPVIGLIQAGAQARADRFTYLPMIGLSIVVVWGIGAALEARPRIRLALAATVCAACLVLTSIQVGYWRDSISLYRHAIAVTSDNYVAHFNLASVLDARGDHADAIAQLREAVNIKPYFAIAHAELGQLLAKQGQTEEALVELQTAVKLRPDSAVAHFRLGSVLGSLGRPEAAAAEFSETIRIEPENADAHYNLGTALAQTDRLQGAASEFSTTIRLKPYDADAHFLLGVTLVRLGRVDDAIAQFSDAVRIKPDFGEARQALQDAMGLKRVQGK